MQAFLEGFDTAFNREYGRERFEAKDLLSTDFFHNRIREDRRG